MCRRECSFWSGFVCRNFATLLYFATVPGWESWWWLSDTAVYKYRAEKTFDVQPCVCTLASHRCRQRETRLAMWESTEPEFSNFQGAQESIPRNQFRQAVYFVLNFMSGIRTRAARVKGFPETKCLPSGSNMGSLGLGHIVFISTGPPRIWTTYPQYHWHPGEKLKVANISANFRKKFDIVIGYSGARGNRFVKNPESRVGLPLNKRIKSK